MRLDRDSGRLPVLAGDSPQVAAAGRYRWTVCALLFVATSINYMDRQGLAILAPTLQAQIGWNEQEYGHIVTAFQAAYAIGVLGFGWLVDKYGTKLGYSVAVFIWSAAECGHALARSALGFGLARFGLGFGEGGNFPAAIKAIAEWFPPEERALATGLFNSGCSFGTIFAAVVVPWTTEKYGWPASFLVLGLAGFVWMIGWTLFYRNHKPPGLPAAPDKIDPRPSMSWRKVLSANQSWVYIVGNALTAPIYWFYLYWTPKFLFQRFGVPLSGIGVPMLIIYLCATVGSIGGGWISSALLRKGSSLNVARKVGLGISGACAIPVICVPGVESSQAAVWLIGLAAAGHLAWAANLFTIVSDLFPKTAVASVVGIGLTISALTGMVFAEYAGFSLQSSHGSYVGLFRIAGSTYVVAFAIMHALAPKYKPVEPGRLES
jgi:ACS family hexuronate transporter-like MFS transporter